MAKTEGADIADRYFDKVENEEVYLIEFLFQLTIVYRDLNESLEGDERKVTLAQINEINHRILNRVRDIRAGEKWTTRSATSERIRAHCEEAPKLKGLVKYASEQAFNIVST